MKRTFMPTQLTCDGEGAVASGLDRPLGSPVLVASVASHSTRRIFRVVDFLGLVTSIPSVLTRLLNGRLVAIGRIWTGQKQISDYDHFC